MAASVEVRLDDEVSGPADKSSEAVFQLVKALAGLKNAGVQASGALFKVASAQERLSASANKFNANVAKSNKQSLFRDKLNKQLIASDSKLRGGLQQSGDALEGMSGGSRLAALAMDLLKEVIVAVVKVALEMAKAIGAAVLKFTVLAQSAKGTFQQLTGAGPKAAQKQIKQTAQLAADLGLDVGVALKQFNKLIAFRFEPEAARQIIAMSADLVTLGASADEAQRVVGIIQDIKSQGKLAAGDLSDLADAGIDSSRVFEALAKNLDITVDAARKLVKAGKVTAEQGIKAIGDAIKKKLKLEKFGDAARKQVRTLGGFVNFLKSNVQLALLEIGEKIAPDLQKALDKLDLAGFFKSKEFETIKTTIGTVFSAIVKSLDVVIPLFKAFVKGIASMLETAGPGASIFSELLGELFKNKDTMKGLVAIFRLFGQIQATVWVVLAAAVGILAAVVGAIGFLVGKVMAATTAIKNWINSLGEVGGILGSVLGAVIGLGGGIISGLIRAIVGGAGSVDGAIKSVVEGAIAAAKSALGISSPSALFRDIGVNTMVGFQMGLADEGPRVSAATAGVIDPAALSALGPRGGVTNLSADTNAQINVQGAGDPSEVAVRVRDVLLDELAGTFEQLNIEVSG